MEDQNNEGSQNSGEGAPATINIAGTDYSLEEAQSLIGLGKKTQELETKYNTKLDRVWPEYGRVTQEYKTTQTELEKARGELSKFQEKRESGTESSDDVSKAREAARKLGITFTEDLEKSGYIKKDDLPKYFEDYSKQQKAVEGVLAEAERLSKEINGQDGRPKFKKNAVLAYAQAYGKADLNEAYEDMYKEELDEWKQTQIEKSKKSPFKTLNGGSGGKAPERVKITDNNFKEALQEKLYSKG